MTYSSQESSPVATDSTTSTSSSVLLDTESKVPIDLEMKDAPTTVISDGTGIPATTTLERQVKSRSEIIIYVLLFVVLDLSKMLCSYALKYYNNDEYPVKQTLIVLSTELLKLFIVLVQLINDNSIKDVSLSLLFALPSVIYAINNNLFLYAFHFTTPAIWSILTQSRIIITALVYRLLFKKHITSLQWFALLLLCVAMVITKLSGDSGGIYIAPMAFLLAGVVSLLSVLAAILMEYFFKNNKRSFMEQQFQLYLYSSLFALMFYSIDLRYTNSNSHTSMDTITTTGTLMAATVAAAKSVTQEPTSTTTTEYSSIIGSNVLSALLLATVQLGAMSGLITATVIKKLDNIVKIYSQSLTGILNAVFSCFLFPRTFSPDLRYVAALLCVLIAIALYERKQLRYVDSSSSTSSPRAS